jgi:predicted nuclease with TOPRIM domain
MAIINRSGANEWLLEGIPKLWDKYPTLEEAKQRFESMFTIWAEELSRDMNWLTASHITAMSSELLKLREENKKLNEQLKAQTEEIDFMVDRDKNLNNSALKLYDMLMASEKEVEILKANANNGSAPSV